MTPERLAAFRKTFGPTTTEEPRPIAEGRKKTNLSEENLGALRLLLAERNGGEQVVVQPDDPPKTMPDSPKGRRSSVANPPSAKTPQDMDRRTSNQPLAVSGRRRLLAGFCFMFVVATALLALPATRDELLWLRVSDDEGVADEVERPGDVPVRLDRAPF